MTFDKNYKAKRQIEQQQKTKNIGSGFLKAGKNIGKFFAFKNQISN